MVVILVLQAVLLSNVHLLEGANQDAVFRL